jgi:16S rRNA (guanine966-N2)-methyltransferase
LESLVGSLHGASFADLYAGSGAVGLEAASRGARPVLLVEQDPVALAALRANATALGLPEVHVQRGGVERVLAEGAPDVAASDGFRVVFLDPPYAQPVERTLELVVENGWVAAGGVVVVERATRNGTVAWPRRLQAERSRRYGEATLWYGRRP